MNKIPEVYVVSDSLGDTAERVAKATISQFDEDIDIVRVPFIRHAEPLQKVIEEAAQHHAENVLGTEHGQQAQSLGHTHLHSTIGKGLQCQTQHHIDGCHYTAVHQLTDGRILIHDNTPAV